MRNSGGGTSIIDCGHRFAISHEEKVLVVFSPAIAGHHMTKIFSVRVTLIQVSVDSENSVVITRTSGSVTKSYKGGNEQNM